MATDTLTLKFKGIDEVTPATKSINTSLDGLGKSASTIAKGALAAVAVGAAAISVELYSAAKAAMEAEENMARLKKALENSGQATKSNLDALVEQSAELQRTTKYSDDAIQSLQSLALNLGASAEETKAITTASIDMAAALGTDANTAARLLSLSLQGNVTGLGKLLPEVKNMTDAQLAHGDAIALVAKKYQGFAENEGQTFAGTLAKVSNAFGDLQEEIGAIFTDNEGLKDTLAGLVPILDDIKTLVIENKDGMRDMVTYGLTLVINSFAMMAEGGVVVVDTLFALMEGYKRAAIALDEFNQKITPWETSGISDRIAEAKAELAGIVQMREQFAQTGTKIFGIAEAAKELAEQAGKANYQQEQTAIVMDTVTVSTDRATKSIQDQKKALESAADEVANYRKEIEEYDRSMGLYEWSGDMSGEQPSQQSQQPQGNNTVNDISGLLSSAGGGNVAAVVTSAMAAVLPGIGSAIAAALGPVMDLIIKGNKEDMDNFFIGIADQVVNLAKNIDDFVVSLIENADEIIVAIAMLPTTLVTELLTNLPDILASLVTGVWDGIKGFFGSVVDTFKNIGDSVAEWFGKDKKEGRDLTSDEAKALTDYLYQSGALSDREYVTARQGIDRTDEQIASDRAYIESLGMTRRAFGGPVTAGESYIVGDGQDGSMRNAEVFVPSKSGTIMPKGSNGGANINVNITADQNPRVTAQYVTSAVKYLIDSKQWRFDPIRNLAVA